MENQEIMLLARLKLLMRKGNDQALDLERFIKDEVYAKGMLDLAINSNDEQLIITGMKLKQLHGFLPKPELHDKSIEADDNVKKKYIGSVR